MSGFANLLTVTAVGSCSIMRLLAPEVWDSGGKNGVFDRCTCTGLTMYLSPAIVQSACGIRGKCSAQMETTQTPRKCEGEIYFESMGAVGRGV